MINTQTPDVKKDKVPKWSKAAFQDKFNIMKGKLESSEEGEKKLFPFPLREKIFVNFFRQIIITNFF